MHYAINERGRLDGVIGGEAGMVGMHFSACQVRICIQAVSLRGTPLARSKRLFSDGVTKQIEAVACHLFGLSQTKASLEGSIRRIRIMWLRAHTLTFCMIARSTEPNFSLKQCMIRTRSVRLSSNLRLLL
jgi:hypothetical protein